MKAGGSDPARTFQTLKIRPRRSAASCLAARIFMSWGRGKHHRQCAGACAQIVQPALNSRRVNAAHFPDCII
jgi:hypothetical protein